MSSRGRYPPRGKTSSNKESSKSETPKWKLRYEGSGFEAWGGYMQAKMQKLQDQFGGEGSGSDIFKGIHVYVNGYTKPSSDELRRLLTSHGGVFEQYLYRTRVTHIVATNLPDSKVKELKGMKVVRPEWITESVTAGELLPYTNYQLYAGQSRFQPGLSSFTKTSVQSRSSSTTSSTAEPSKGNHSISDQAAEAFEDIDDDILLEDEELASHDTETSKHVDRNRSAESLTGSYHEKSPGKKIAKAGDSNFLSEFYTNSRLHHISTWGAEYRAYVSKLQKQNNGVYPGRERLHEFHQTCLNSDSSMTVAPSGKPKKVIMHVDMDCFFVSVGLLDKPELRGRPVAVTHSKGKGAVKETPGSDPNFERTQWELRRLQQGGKKGRRSNVSGSVGTTFDEEDEDEVIFLEPDQSTSSAASTSKSETFHSFAEIASCSYEARKAGVKNGMFMGRAKELCSELVTIPYNFDKYQEVSRTLYDTVASFTHDIEAVSCDEMLVDCTDLLADTGGTPEEFATLLRQEVYEKTGCTASAGLAESILLARLATRAAKPNGQFLLTRDAVPEFISKQSVRDLPGVGYSMSRKLASLSVTTCEDLQKLSLGVLQKEFGPKTGQSLFNYCRGQDDRQIKMEKERKSVSAEINYGIRFQKEPEAQKFLCDLSEEVSTRLKNINMRGKTITLKLMVRRGDAPKETAKFLGHGICNNLSKSSSLPVATDDPKVIAKECIFMLHALKAKAVDLRGIGIQTHRLEPSVFAPSASGAGNQSILNFAVHKQKPVSSSSGEQNENGIPDGQTAAVKARVSPEMEDLSDEGMDEDLIGDHKNGDDSSSEALVFNCSSRPILEELARKKTSKKQPPPLPSLPDFSSPDTPRSKPVFETRNEPQDYFPSPSQIDPEVLKELPPDIRAQIETDMATKRGNKKTAEVPDATNHREADAPGCSHWPSQEADATNEEQIDDSPRMDFQEMDQDEPEQDVGGLPSFSQLDMSCLNALPDYMQEEIRMEYERKEKQSAEQRKKDVPTLQLQQARSPSKAQATDKSPKKSPGRSKKTSPVFKVPRGRPAGKKNKKLSPKKLNFHVQKKVPVSAVKEVSSTMSEPETGASDNPLPPAVAEEQNNIIVNLCGAVTITEVRELLSEWLDSCPVPQSEDVDVMLEYLGQLVFDHNLEQVDLVLKFLNRKICKLANNHWRNSFNNLLSNTQEVIKSMHGCQLNVDWLKAR